MEFIPAEKGVPIRQPSTANLMIDSFDRKISTSSPFAFDIIKNQSIMNGFFTRIGTTELVLEWRENNISNALQNTQIVITQTGSPADTITVPSGLWTVYSALTYIVDALNTIHGAGTYVLDATNPNNLILTATGGATFVVAQGNLQNQLGLTVDVAPTAIMPILGADLRPFRYIDFVCSQLTYNQELKDGSTNPVNKDVLARWYFDWDSPPTLDAGNQPIYMGYSNFSARRLFNPPKQIKWSGNQPIGNLTFEVFGYSMVYPNGVALSSIYPTSLSNWLMTLQVSEV